jgi:hypothetical protein
MKKQTKIKNGFYKGYMQDKQPRPTAKQQEQIVIVNQREKDSIAKVLFNAVGYICRFIIYIIVFGLSSVGLTTLLNVDIREIFLELFL